MHDLRMELYNQGKNDRQIADAIGVGDTAIYKWRKQHGLKANYTPNLKDNRLELYNQGLTDQEIAKAIGKNPQAIKEWRKVNKLKNNRPAVSREQISASICWNCTRARALPDPYGCAFHRKEHRFIFAAAVVADRRNNGTEYKSVTVTECEHWELSIRDMRDRAKILNCGEA